MVTYGGMHGTSLGVPGGEAVGVGRVGVKAYIHNFNLLISLGILALLLFLPA